MAFGIPGSESTGGGEFLGRIQYDTRVGFWQTVKRVQGDGGWVDDKGEQFKNPTMLFDMGTLEVGYIKFSSPPAFLVVPYGQPIPPQPQEMSTDAAGKTRKAFLPGFRVKVASAKVFGDGAAYYFAHNAKTVMEPMDELYQIYEQAPEAAQGKVPLVAVTGTRLVEIKSPQGTNRYHAPIFAIQAWYDRLEVFGPRTVPPPAARAPAMTTQAARQMAAASVQQAAPEAQGWGAPATGTVTPPPQAPVPPAPSPTPSAAAPVGGMPF
jgi:hypothetical protein